MHLGLVDYVFWYSVPFVLAGVLAARCIAGESTTSIPTSLFT